MDSNTSSETTLLVFKKGKNPRAEKLKFSAAACPEEENGKEKKRHAI